MLVFTNNRSVAGISDGTPAADLDCMLAQLGIRPAAAEVAREMHV
jgi:hypothetical protein